MGHCPTLPLNWRGGATREVQVIGIPCRIGQGVPDLVLGYCGIAVPDGFFSASNATSLKLVRTVQECKLLMRSICIMDNFIRPEHRHTGWKNIWHDNRDSSGSLAKPIHANSIKHNNVLLSNEFPKNRTRLCVIPHRNSCVSGPFMHKALWVNTVWNHHHCHLAVASLWGKAGYGFARVNEELRKLSG